MAKSSQIPTGCFFYWPPLKSVRVQDPNHLWMVLLVVRNFRPYLRGELLTQSARVLELGESHSSFFVFERSQVCYIGLGIDKTSHQSIGERAFFERRSERRSQSMNVSENAFILCGRERELELVPIFP